MQATPARSPQCLDGPIERGGRHQRQQHQRHKAHQDERPLHDVGHDIAHVERHVEPAVAQQVQRRIEKHKYPQHAPKARELGGRGHHPDRRHRQHHAQCPQGPVARGTHQGLGRVGAQLIREGGIQQPEKRTQARHEHQGLGSGREQ